MHELFKIPSRLFWFLFRPLDLTVNLGGFNHPLTGMLRSIFLPDFFPQL